MPKLVLNDINKPEDISLINDNFTKIEDEFTEKVLYRDNPIGEPNPMENDLDMNSNDILNVDRLYAKWIDADNLSPDGSLPVRGPVDKDELLKWDDAHKALIGSGVYSYRDGEITTDNNSINIGIHDVGSMGENVGFYNLVTKKLYFPSWQGVGISDSDTFNAVTRDHGPYQAGVVRESVRNTVMTNPEWTIDIPNDETVFRIGFYFVNTPTNLRLINSENGSVVYDSRLHGTITPGTLSVLDLESPVDLDAGKTIGVKLISEDGDVKVYGSNVSKLPTYSVWIREFTDKPLATEEFVNSHVGVGNGDMLKSVYDQNSNNIVDLAEAVHGADAAGNSKYYGTDSTGTVGFHDFPDDELDELKKTVEAHTTAINTHGTEIQQHESQIETNKNNVDIALQTARAADQHLTDFRKGAVSGIVARADDAHKTITISLTSPSGDVDHAMVDLSSWIGGVTPSPTDFDIYYGFAQNPPLNEADLLRLGTKRTVNRLDGLRITLTRSDSTPKNMYVWIPDSAGDVKGFEFSGFLSVWGSSALNVSGADGKFYVSPQQTATQDVTFEVRA